MSGNKDFRKPPVNLAQAHVLGNGQPEQAQVNIQQIPAPVIFGAGVSMAKGAAVVGGISPHMLATVIVGSVQTHMSPQSAANRALELLMAAATFKPPVKEEAHGG